MKYKNLWRGLLKIVSRTNNEQPLVISRQQHGVSRKKMSANAVKVLYRLQKAGFAAYLVGGSVRDLLLEIEPKDFDVATDALPEQVRKLFGNSRIIGRRFRLVHVFFQDEIIEVSTFRANVSEEPENEEEVNDNAQLIRSDNTYGTIEEDAWRRDFTVNSLYYNIADFSIIDFTGGIQDLQQKMIRMIGDPKQRYHEDPVRLLRAIRLSAKLNFKIHSETEKPIFSLSHLLQHIPSARLLEEIIKMLLTGYAGVTFRQLRHYNYLQVLFPQTYQALHAPSNQYDEKFIHLALTETDNRYHRGLPLHPAYLFAVMLWPAFQYWIAKQKAPKNNFYLLHDAITAVISEQRQRIAIPKRLVAMIRSIWILQFHLIKRRPNRADRLVRHRYFRAAVDFLETRANTGEKLQALAKWWRKYYQADEKQREKMLATLNKKKSKNNA